MAYDPTITTGNVLTIVAVVATAVTFLIKQSYSAGRYSQEFLQVHKDLGEIKETLKKQDSVFMDKVRADSLADGIQLVIQQRVSTLEAEMQRARENIHNIAQTVQKHVFMGDPIVMRSFGEQK